MAVLVVTRSKIEHWGRTVREGLAGGTRLVASRIDASRGEYLSTLTSELAHCESVLDVGCGRDSPLRHVRGEFRSVGVDAHLPSIEASRAARIHHDYIHDDLRNLKLPPDSFDGVLVLDLIEHLERETGETLLILAETVARMCVVVLTPNGYLSQGAIDGNELQAHRSGWSVNDFTARGYVVKGLNGWKPLRGELSYPRRPAVITRPLSMLSYPIVRRRPQLAFHLLAVKRLAAVSG